MNATTHPQTQITADPNLPTLTIVREFDATPDKVFRAHVDPELIVQWLGPDDVAMRLDTWDPRTGGSYRYVGERDGEEFGFFGAFHEVRPNERIVQTFTFEGVPDGVSLETATFEALPGGRTRLTALSVVDSIEARDAMVASGMETGVVQGYESLDDLLANDR
ncbi:MAG: SRPBCC family protein [Nocardioidaceae bacterium]